MILPKHEYLSYADMDNLYSEVLRQMSNAAMVPDAVIAISRGGLDFGVKVSHYYDNIPLHPLVWQTRDSDTQQVQALHDILSGYIGRNVLIVDDILDDGKTVVGLKDVTDHYNADIDIYYGVAIENSNAQVEADFSGRVIYRGEDSQWFVFPWENWWKTK